MALTYDAFMFNGELDILEIRLNILKDFVDTFVIVEAKETFSGNLKPLYFFDNRERFKKFAKKIEYYVVDTDDDELWEMARLSKNTIGAEHWKREFVIKESIKKPLVGLRDWANCFISDVDEIWNPEAVIDYYTGKPDLYKFKQLVSVYYLNNRSSEEWAGTLACPYSMIKNSCLNHLRTIKEYKLIENGGWHFTNMGGMSEVRRKLNDSYTTESYNTYSVQEKLTERMKRNEDYLGRNFRYWTDDTSLPHFVKWNRTKYKHLYKPTV